MVICNENILKGAEMQSDNDKLCEQLENVRLDDLEKLCKEINNLPKCDNVAMNCRYGHAYHLKNYTGIEVSTFLNCTIEHGLNIIHDSVCAVEVSQHCKKILTISPYRKDIIERNTDIEAIAIGPYIAYAEDYYSEEKTKKMKEVYGRTLLVFPTHSAENLGVKYDNNLFLRKIDLISKDFDTVLVCLYYRDIVVQTVNLYRERGYIVVSAGGCYDKYFLPRQRTIFRLSDAVMGNDFSTGLAYAMYFDKPVFLFRQSVEMDGYGIVNTAALERKHEHMDKLYELCSDPKFGRLNEQKEWAKYMLGIDCVKTREEMKDILFPLIRKKRV